MIIYVLHVYRRIYIQDALFARLSQQKYGKSLVGSVYTCVLCQNVEGQFRSIVLKIILVPSGQRPAYYLYSETLRRLMSVNKTSSTPSRQASKYIGRLNNSLNLLKN